MASPTYGSVNPLAGGSGTTAAIPVPTGTANNELVLCSLYVETDNTITKPSGFFQAAVAENNTSGENFRLYLFWKRCTGTDSGTYDFTWTGSAWKSGTAIRISGADTTGDPFDTTPVTTATTVDATQPGALSLTNVTADTLLFYVIASFNGVTTFTLGGGFTERHDADETAAYTLAQAATGTTGNVQATANASDALCAIFGAIRSLPAPSGGAFTTVLRSPIQSGMRLN